MRKASSEPGPAPSADAIDGGTVSARASAGVAWHVPEIAVTLPEGLSRTRGMNARGRRSHCRPPGRTRGHGSAAGAGQLSVHLLSAATSSPRPGTTGRAAQPREPG